MEVEQLKLRLTQLEKLIYSSRHQRFVPENGSVVQQLTLGLQDEAM